MIWNGQNSEMRKRSAWLGGLLVLVFLSAQVLSLHHTAEFGDATHSHNGQMCDISTYGDRTDDCDAPVSISYAPRSFADPSAAPVSFVLIVDPQDTRPPSRAPPHSRKTA